VIDQVVKIEGSVSGHIQDGHAGSRQNLPVEPIALLRDPQSRRCKEGTIANSDE
jgi:hypothetical protein